MACYLTMQCSCGHAVSCFGFGSGDSHWQLSLSLFGNKETAMRRCSVTKQKDFVEGTLSKFENIGKPEKAILPPVLSL